jgi:SAM-dependent methyltransferase
MRRSSPLPSNVPAATEQPGGPAHSAHGVTESRYVPAAGRGLLTRFYDPAMAVTMREGRWRPRLVESIAGTLPHGGTVVDVGAGTGTLAIALGERRPDAEIVAVDGDPEALAIARAKPGAGGIAWHTGLAGELPRGDHSADAVVMSLLLHHLAPDDKAHALAEAHRVLRAGGRLHIADWGRPHDPLMRGAFLVVQALDGFANTRDHAAGRVASLVAAAGFRSVALIDRYRTAVGTLELIAAGA